jgi:phosphodiesterase/alkaline phosphatase D-like protein
MIAALSAVPAIALSFAMAAGLATMSRPAPAKQLPANQLLAEQLPDKQLPNEQSRPEQSRPEQVGAEPSRVEVLDRAPAPVIAAGDVTEDSAVLWVQADRVGTVMVELASDEASDSPPLQFQRQIDPDADYTVKIRVDGLTPATRYRWRAAVVSAPEPSLGAEPSADSAAQGPMPDEIVGGQALGTFSTAPDPYAAAPVRLIWGGGLAGQNVCRDAERGFEIFAAIGKAVPDLLVGAGDMIYADGLCEAVGRYGNPQIPASFGKATDLQGFRAHWRYSRADLGLRRLLAETAYYPLWDDHEVIKDLGPLHDTRDEPPYRAGEHLLPPGLTAMLEQNPIGENPLTPKRLYRGVRWGQHLELLLLDTRQYRDANSAPDSPERPKTLLGREQLTWLKQRLATSDATWVVVVSSVPLSIATGSSSDAGRDGWSDPDGRTGFGQELRAILEHAALFGRDKLLFVSADANYGAAFRYTPFRDRPGFVVHELVSGPLSAGIGSSGDVVAHAGVGSDAASDVDRDGGLANDPRDDLQGGDPPSKPFSDPRNNQGRRDKPRLGVEQLFEQAPASRDAVVNYAEARGYFNFGEIAIDAAGELTATLRDVDGAPLYVLRLTPASATRLAGLAAVLASTLRRPHGP